MTSLTRCTWVWVSSGSWRWTGRPSVLQFMGLQKVGHDWATELNWTEQECVCYMWLHMTGPHKASSGAQGTPHWWYPWTDPMVWAQCPAALRETHGRPLHIGTSSLNTLLNSQVGGRDRVEKAYHLQSLGCCLSLRVWFRGSNLTLRVSSSSVIQGWCWSQLPTSVLSGRSCEMGKWQCFVDCKVPYGAKHHHFLSAENYISSHLEKPKMTYLVWVWITGEKVSTVLRIFPKFAIFTLKGMTSYRGYCQPPVALGKPWENHHGKRIKAKYSNIA